MITVYYAKVFPFPEENTFLSHATYMGEEQRKKILRIKSPSDRNRSITAYELLYRALCLSFGLSPKEQEPFVIGYEEGGKPYLAGREDTHFNLSHSGDYVCCAIGDLPVGTDIQKNVPVRKNLAERFFTASDNLKLQNCGENEREQLFCRMWSIKESFIKFTGKGMKQGLASFEIDWQNGQIWEVGKDKPSAYFEEQNRLPGYGFCVCFGRADQEILWKEMKITT